MNIASSDITWDGSAPLRDAMALAALARDCVSSGVERRALHVRLSMVSPKLREARHQRMVREALAPVLRPTRARLYELPGGDLVALSPPPGEHLDEVRASVARLLPEIPMDILVPVLRLPAEAARLLSLVEVSLGLQLVEPIQAEDAGPKLPAPSATEVEAAMRALTTANLTSFLRHLHIWQLGADDQEPQRIYTELRPHVQEVASVLMPGRALAASPALARRFRQATERRMLAELSRPQEARALANACLPLSLGAVMETEFLRLDAMLGPTGRARLMVCVSAGDVLADPGGFDMVRRLAAQRGWRLGLDDVEPAMLQLLPASRLDLAVIRLRFRPDMLAADARARDAMDAALPEDRSRVVLIGTDAPIAIAWAWQRGITRFMGRLLEARL